MEGFPKRLGEIRKARGMTQAELAQKAGLSKGAIGNYEAGKRINIAYPIITALANALDVSIEELLGRKDIRDMAQDNGFDYSKAEFLYVGQGQVTQAAKDLGNLRQSFIQVGFTAEESFELIKLMLEINNKKG